MNATVTLSVDTLALAHEILMVHLKCDPVLKSDPSLRRRFRAAQADLRLAQEAAAREALSWQI